VKADKLDAVRRQTREHFLTIRRHRAYNVVLSVVWPTGLYDLTAVVARRIAQRNAQQTTRSYVSDVESGFRRVWDTAALQRWQFVSSTQADLNLNWRSALLANIARTRFFSSLTRRSLHTTMDRKVREVDATAGGYRNDS
jgi:hypothetical protein